MLESNYNVIFTSHNLQPLLLFGKKNPPFLDKQNGEIFKRVFFPPHPIPHTESRILAGLRSQLGCIGATASQFSPRRDREQVHRWKHLT